MQYAVLLLIVMMSLQILPVFAENTPVSWDWKIRFWWQDNIVERLADNSADKLRTLTNHVEELQREIQAKAMKNEEIPDEFEVRRQNVLDKAESVLETIKSKMPVNAQDKSDVTTRLTNAFDNRINELKRVGEYNDILQAVHDFQKLKSIDDPDEKKQFAHELDARINLLHSVKSGCEKRIDSIAISESNDPYKELQQNYCNKSLNGIELNEIRSYYGL